MGSDQEHAFSRNYLILKPENANILDLFLFLLPFGWRRRRFIDCSKGIEDSLRKFTDRCSIVISMLLQIILLAFATPLAKLDSFLLNLFNFISFNGGVLGLFFKILTVKKLVWPDKNSPEYMSLAAFTDWRRDLDSSIEPSDTFRYYSALTVMAAKISYEFQPYVQSVVNHRWGMNLLGYFDFWNDFQRKATTQAFMFETTATDPNVTVVAFRGTSPLDAYDWQVDADFSWYEIEGVGRMHSGFMKALGLQKTTGWPKELPAGAQHDFAYYTLRQKLRDIARANHNARFIITGHSLGGALATVFVTILALHDESSILEKLEAVYTYGQPRVGNRDFAKFMVDTVQKYGFKYYRYVYSSDLVPRVPFDGIFFKYRHFGKVVYFNSLYRGRILKEQPYKNYISLFWAIPKFLSAWWEVIRSWIIPFVRGFDYYETLLMRGARVVGLLVPGVAAHFPVNYVNITRLGKLRMARQRQLEEPILEDDIEPDY